MANNFAKDYVDVAARIKEFKDTYPAGTLQSWRDPYIVEVAGKSFVVYAAAAFRTADDTRPGIGWAWEPVPGPTPYTRDSELMNAETSAWGRAIVALGFPTKHIASEDEVLNRRGDEPPRQFSHNRPPKMPPAAAEGPTLRDKLNVPLEWKTELNNAIAERKMTNATVAAMLKITPATVNEFYALAYEAISPFGIAAVLDEIEVKQ